MIRPIIFLPGLVFALMLAVVPVHAATPVTACGTIISAAGDYQLTANLGPCSGDGVVIVASDVNFDLAGFAITGVSTPQSCDTDSPQYGIHVTAAASNVHVTGGTVGGFVDGVVLFASQSRASALILSAHCLFGIVVAGTGNVVAGSTITGSGVDGVGLAGEQHVLETSAITDNRRYGLTTGGGGSHVVRDNFFARNGTLIQQGGAVAVLGGDNAQILHNLVVENFDGIFLQTAGHRVEDNTATDNLSVGIAVGVPGAATLVAGNTATGNGTADLADANPACGSNTWRDNVFVTDLVAAGSDGGPATGCITGIAPVPVSIISGPATGVAMPGSADVFAAFPRGPAVGPDGLSFLGVGVGGQTGVYSVPSDPISPPSPIRVADLTTPIPEGSGAFIGFDAVAVAGASVAFTATGGGGQQGVYVAKPDGPPVRVADLGTPIPEGVGTFTSFASLAAGDTSVAFLATGGGGQQGVYTAVPQGPPTRVADLGTPIPEGVGTFTSFASLAAGDTSLAFIATGGGGQEGVYVARPEGPPGRVADVSTLIPQGVGTFTAFADVATDDTLTAFVGTGGGGQEGVYVALPNGPPNRVADLTTPIPGGAGSFTGFAALSTSDGHTAFLGLGAFGQAGIYVASTLAKVIAVGDALDKKVVTTLRLERSGLKSRTLAFTAGFDDGTEGVYLADVNFLTFDFAGFFQPVDNLPVLNRVNAGQAVPVRFSLRGDRGLDVFAVRYPRSETIPCSPTAVVDGIEQTVAAGSSSLAYSPGTDQYTYVWKTDKVWSNTCRQLVMKFKDGSTYRASFRFR
jgi:hypothetical protein